ncbi:hydrogenase maturation nickel metallochaperone HypA [Candidatus Micrarchaeota archaeon]|nr:hydrogenase maturation nickel metallochaperone HypA [Candidatus Micrarchaeota archaeon]
MHELHLAGELVEQARREGEVEAVEVEVGELALLTAEELREALARLVSWKARLVEKRARVKCGCGFEGRPKITAREHDLVLFECPACGKVPAVLEGDSIILKSVVLKAGK